MGGPESESEGVAALKRAYAEMVMSTARESAERVARSEAQAVRMQRELSAVKDESLRLLLRMKRLGDAKATEAEVASSSRQSKVNELESQLHEAEGIIVDLRAEINWIRDKVEKLRNNQLTALNSSITKGDDLPSQNSASQSTRLSLSHSQLLTPEASVVKNILSDHKIIHSNCFIAKEQEAQWSFSRFTSHCSSDSEIASDTMRNKELEQGKVGFEQKDILLNFGNQLAENLSLSEIVDLHSVKVQDSAASGTYEDGESCSKSDLTIQKVEQMELLLGGSRKGLEVTSLTQSEDWFGRDKSNCSSPLNQLIRPYPLPSILSRCRKKYPTDNHFLDTLFRTETKKNDTKNYQESKEEPPYRSSFSKDEKETVREGKRQKVEDQGTVCNLFFSHVAQQYKVFLPQSHFLSDGGMPSMLSIRGSLKSGEAQPKMSENGVKLKPLRPGLTLLKGVPLSGSANITRRSMAHCRSLIPGVLNKDIDLACGRVKQKDRPSCHSAVTHCQSYYGNDKVHAPHASGERVVTVLSEDSDFRAEASGERFFSPGEKATTGLLKYTFQQKHKKEPLTALDQNSLPGVDAGDRMVEKHDGSFKSYKFSLIPDLSKDNAQLTQVACQPISLSEERR